MAGPANLGWIKQISSGTMSCTGFRSLFPLPTWPIPDPQALSHKGSRPYRVSPAARTGTHPSCPRTGNLGFAQHTHRRPPNTVALLPNPHLLLPSHRPPCARSGLTATALARQRAQLLQLEEEILGSIEATVEAALADKLASEEVQVGARV